MSYRLFLILLLGLQGLHAGETRATWWSLKPVVRPEVPTVAGESNPVDAFILAKLKQEGVEPVGGADPVTLIRRLTLDLTGLPPSRSEVEAFTRHSEIDLQGAVEQAVHRLLDSPAFGEKWAGHWLDVARYAETHGYDKDKLRDQAWPYRDYVIRSLNQDKSYTRFVREQVAGDVLYPGEPDGVLGLGFLAAGPWDFISHWEVGEGKLDGRIAKHLDRDEMISAVFNVFQSTTVQCAQCHDHKFDPVRMEDYYRLHAVFAAVDRADRVYDGLDANQQKQKEKLLAGIERDEKERKALEQSIQTVVNARVQPLEKAMAQLRERYPSSKRPEYGYHSAISPRQDVEKWVQVDLGQEVRASRIRLVPAHDDYNNIGAGFGFPVRYRVEATDQAPDHASKPVMRTLLDATQADQPNPGFLPVDVPPDGKPVRVLRVTATRLGPRKGDYILALGEVQVWDESGELVSLRAKVTALDSIEAPVRWGKGNLTDGIYYRPVSDDAAVAEWDRLEKERRRWVSEATPKGQAERLREVEKSLEAQRRELKALPEGRMVYAVATQFRGGGRFQPTGGTPRPIHLLNRGDLRSPGDRMTPGAPPLWAGVPERFPEGTAADEASARAELALYLTRSDNPLLWRSIVNRLWQWSMGQPLAGTPNDLGRMGGLPSHPELLDWLAWQLREDPNHSLKSILRLIFTSEAYRRASSEGARQSSMDGGNAWRWRADRRRLTAEEYRDALLQTAGLLDLRQGGPSFRDFVLEKPQHSPHYEYQLHDPADPATHRRTIYRFVVRSQPQPFLTTLDCADPSISTAVRDESTTALQALAQWNNRLVAYCAEQFGKRIQDVASENAGRVDFACWTALGRGPSPEERALLGTLLREQGPAHLARVLYNMNAFVYLD